MYKSQYYTCEEIDERLLKGYYNDAVSKGYSDTFEQFKTELASIKDISANSQAIETKANKTYVDTQLSTKVSQADLDALIAELVLRLQGTSTNQDGYKDPIFYKEFVGSATLDDMNTWLNNQFFAIKDGVYYRNGQSGSYAISKDVPQCLINLSFQGVKIYIYNAPRSFAEGRFEQFAIGATARGNGITWGSHIMRRESTYDFVTKKATWTAWEKINSDVDKSYVDTQLATKVDKVTGKGLSTNDYTTAEKTKLAGIETGANKTIVDEQLSTSSTNPVQNMAVAASLNAKVNIILGKGLSTNDYTNAEKNLVSTVPDKADKTYVDTQLATKVDKVSGKGLSTNDFTDAEKTKLSTVESGANRTVVDTSLSNTSSNPVQNKIINAALLGKANAAHSHTFSQILEKPTTLEGYGITDAEVKGASNTALASANSYTDNKIANIINGAPDTLDTLKEIADAMEENESVVAALNQAIGTKATKDEFTAHSTNTDIHINSEERVKWNDSYNKRHSHTNKSVLDSTTASYTTAEKTKLSGIETGANKTIIDTELSATSTNPVQNKIVTTKLNTKVDKVSGKGLSTNDYTTEEKNLVATIPSKASEEYVDENILQLAKQRTSFITPCFSDCDSTHEAKCKSITLGGGELGFGFKSIFSVTIKIAENLSLRNYTSTYLHIKDLFGNSIGVSMNGVKQMQNLGKYATWFFDSAINTSGAPMVLSLHTTNVASSASDSNRVMIIAHVNQSEGMKGCGVTDENGTYHTNWTPALGINVVNLAAIYPQIKELQKYRMAYATSELPDISTTGHKANIKEIHINQSVMGISLVNSVSIMVASDSAYSGALELRVHDINDNLIASSNNTVNLSQNLGKYVTWYFTPFQLNTDAIYKFSVWSSNTSQVMRIHVASGKSEGVTCFDQNNSPHADYCPAFGINISAIFADDLRKSIKEVNLALGKEILINSNSIDDLAEAMGGVLSDIEQIKENIAVSTTINLEASALGITSDTTLTEGAIIDVYSGESGGGVLSTEITLNAGQTITSSANNIRALTVFAGNVVGRIKHRVLQVGEINYTANEPMSVYVCYRPQGDIHTEVKVKDMTQLEEQIAQKADTGYVNAQVKILTTALETKVDKVSGKGLSTNDYTAEDKNLVTTIPSKASEEYVNNKVSTKADKSYVDTQLATKVDKVAGKGLSSNDFIDRYKFAIQPLAEILEKKNETQNGVVDIVSNYCLGTLWEKESLLNVGAEIPFANHYTFRHKVDKIDGNNQEYIELSCNTYYVDNYTGSANLKELFIKVPYDEHTYILLRCRQYGDGHGYRWIVKEKSSREDDAHDTAKIPYLFSPLRYTDDEVKKLQSTITALEARIAALEAK